MARFEPKVKDEFSKCGITIGGKEPCDIQVKDSRFYSKFLLNPATGIVESFTNGWWTPNDLPSFCIKLVAEWNRLTEYFRTSSKIESALIYILESSLDVFAIRRKRCVDSGVKLAATFLNWIASCDGDTELQKSNSNKMTASSAGKYIFKDLWQMGFQDCYTIQALINDFEQRNFQKEFDSRFYRMWHFYLHLICAAHCLNKCRG